MRGSQVSKPATLAQSQTTPVGFTARPASNSRRAWRRFRSNKLALVALTIALLLGLLALGAPLITRFISHVGPTDQSLLNQFQGTSAQHWLGTDEYGRDVFTRMAYGLRVSLMVGILAAVAHVVIGTLAGAIAGYYGSWVDTVIMRFVDVMLCIPNLFLLILMGALITFKPVTLALVIAALSWFGMARLIRVQILSVKEAEYVEAARVLGASNGRILRLHILPNVTYLIIYSVTGAIPGFILAETALSYLGLGIQPPTPSLGNMLSNAIQYLYNSKGLLIYPGLAIWLIVLALTILGNALRDALDPRASS